MMVVRINERTWSATLHNDADPGYIVSKYLVANASVAVAATEAIRSRQKHNTMQKEKIRVLSRSRRKCRGFGLTPQIVFIASCKDPNTAVAPMKSATMLSVGATAPPGVFCRARIVATSTSAAFHPITPAIWA